MEPINNLTQEQNDFINKPIIAGAMGPIYALAVGLYQEFWMFLIPFYNIYLFFKLIVHGRKMAWEKSNKDFAYFQNHQKNLSKVAKILMGIFVGFILLEFVVLFGVLFGNFFGGTSSIFGKDIATNFSQNLFTNGDISTFVDKNFVKDENIINFEKDTRGEYKSVSFSSFSRENDISKVAGSVKFSNTSMPVCVSLVKLGEEWKVYNLSEYCD